MNRKEFGNLVAALRREHRDENNSVWTQKQLGAEIGKRLMPSVEGEQMINVVINIENGLRQKLEPELLIAMADALNLTSGERKEFFSAASGVDEKHHSNIKASPTVIRAEVLGLLRKTQLPAFVTDSFGELLAVNAAVLACYNVDLATLHNSQVGPYAKYNLMRLLYSPEFDEQRKLMKDTWESFSYTVIMLFRTLSLRFRAYPYFSQVLAALNSFPLFRARWQSAHLYEHDKFMDNGTLTLYHPALGELHWVGSTLTSVTGFGDLKLYSFTPLNLTTTDFFRSIIATVGEEIFELADWPGDKFSETET